MDGGKCRVQDFDLQGCGLAGVAGGDGGRAGGQRFQSAIRIDGNHRRIRTEPCRFRIQDSHLRLIDGRQELVVHPVIARPQPERTQLEAQGSDGRGAELQPVKPEAEAVAPGVGVKFQPIDVSHAGRADDAECPCGVTLEGNREALPAGKRVVHDFAGGVKLEIRGGGGVQLDPRRRVLKQIGVFVIRVEPEIETVNPGGLEIPGRGFSRGRSQPRIQAAGGREFHRSASDLEPALVISNGGRTGQGSLEPVGLRAFRQGVQCRRRGSLE